MARLHRMDLSHPVVRDKAQQALYPTLPTVLSVLFFTISDRTALQCPVLYCIALLCSVLRSTCDDVRTRK